MHSKFVKLRNRKVISLVGMMGSGKTVVGSLLASRLKIRFIDSDHEIEKLERKAISEIFSMDGEKYFRQREEKMIISCLNESYPMILSLGGGSITNSIVRKLIKEKTVSIWLNASIEAILKRVRKNNSRPLLKKSDPESVVSELMANRVKFYSKSDIKIETDHMRCNTIVETIIEKLNLLINEKE